MREGRGNQEKREKRVSSICPAKAEKSKPGV